uniref:Uncharacterized protein n=1 Tax=Arundo donax TaxID=35708 RepID=A0A0A8ZZ04_ARUDO
MVAMGRRDKARWPCGAGCLCAQQEGSRDRER